MKYSGLNEEKKIWKKGFKKVACLDEAGRGALCGPVVAAAVMIIKNPFLKNRIFRNQNSKRKNNCFFSHFYPEKKTVWSLKLRDSKKLSKKSREKFYKILTNCPEIKWGTGKVSEKIIDKINIKNAAELAMMKAVRKLKIKPNFLIIDGKYLKNEELKSYDLKLIIKADEKVFSCAAASIIAKVTRDRIMMRYHRKYPGYGFNMHKGYPTKKHIKILKKYKPCRIYRKSFGPVIGLKK